MCTHIYVYVCKEDFPSLEIYRVCVFERSGWIDIHIVIKMFKRKIYYFDFTSILIRT